jgi:dihydrofolate reductase
MKLTLILASSIDGITNQGKGEDHHAWRSHEDEIHFNSTRDNANLIIMGSKTYEAAKKFMVHEKGQLRIVLTKNPEKYKDEQIPGQLEFTNETPVELLQRLEFEGFKTGLLVGGAHTNTEFLKNNLVDEVWITVEPYIKGVGLNTAVDIVNVSLQLLSSVKLNDRGTLLLKYKVI